MSSLPPDYKFLADTNPFLTKSKATARAVRPRELHLNHSTDSISSPKHTEPFIIGVAGGTASGKTTVCDEIVSALSNKRVAIIAQDSFYRSLTPAEKDLANRQEYNFDHPDAFDNDLLEKTLVDLRKGRPVQIPVYDFKTHSRLDESITISGADVIIIEGILVLASVGLRNTMHMKVFVDTDADTRLARRIVRDIKERARDLSSVLDQYEKFVKPSFDDYVMPTKKWADIIIPRGGDNTVAIDLLVQHIKLKLGERDRSHDAFFLE